MFSTFKIELNGFSQKIIEEYYKKGVKIYDAHKLIIKKSLDKYLSVDGELKRMCSYLIRTKTKRLQLHLRDY